MKRSLLVLLSLGAAIGAGCSSAAPEAPAIVYEATNPAKVVEEHDGVQYVYLTEGPAYFAEDSIRVKAGSVVFYVTNEADREVTLTVAPFGDRSAENAIFSLRVPKGQTATHRAELEAGLYEYSCPINSTEWYPLTVERADLSED